MRRHNDGGQFTALARGSARAGAQGNTEVEEQSRWRWASRRWYASRSQTVNPSEGPDHQVGPLAPSATCPAPPPRLPRQARGGQQPARQLSTRHRSRRARPRTRGGSHSGITLQAPRPCPAWGGAGAACPARQQRSGCAGQTLSRGRTRTDDLPLTRPPSPHTNLYLRQQFTETPHKTPWASLLDGSSCHKPCHKRSSCSALALSCAAHRAGVSGSVVACVVIPSSTRWSPQRYCGVEM